MGDAYIAEGSKYGHTIFSCPKCNETIDSSAETCRFCGQPVDHEAAVQAAELMARINQACSDASYLKSTAFAIPVFFVARFLPFVSMLGLVGFIGLIFAVPIWSLRWWFKFGRISTNEVDFHKAQSTVKVTGIIVGAILVIYLFLNIFGIVPAMRR